VTTNNGGGSGSDITANNGAGSGSDVATVGIDAGSDHPSCRRRASAEAKMVNVQLVAKNVLSFEVWRTVRRFSTVLMPSRFPKVPREVL